MIEQVLAPASMGVDGVMLWGSSNDYHGEGCSVIGHELRSFVGSTIEDCIRNRVSCAKSHCSGHGRCVDYDPLHLESACVDREYETDFEVSCRCDPGFTGENCATNFEI